MLQVLAKGLAVIPGELLDFGQGQSLPLQFDNVIHVFSS